MGLETCRLHAQQREWKLEFYRTLSSIAIKIEYSICAFRTMQAQWTHE